MIDKDKKLLTAEEAAQRLGVSPQKVREILGPVKVEYKWDDDRCVRVPVRLYRLDQKKKNNTATVTYFEVVQLAKSPPRSHNKRPSSEGELIQRRIDYPFHHIIRITYEDGVYETDSKSHGELIRYLQQSNIVQYFLGKLKFRELYKQYVDNNDVVGGIWEWIHDEYRIQLND